MSAAKKKSLATKIREAADNEDADYVVEVKLSVLVTVSACPKTDADKWWLAENAIDWLENLTRDDHEIMAECVDRFRVIDVVVPNPVKP